MIPHSRELSPTGRLPRGVGPGLVSALTLLPGVAFLAGVLPLSLRFHVALGCFVAMLFVIAVDGFGLRRLGLRLDNFRSTLLPYAVLTLAGIAVTVGVAQMLGRGSRPITLSWGHVRFYIAILLPLCFAQELVFRGYLVPALEAAVRNPWARLSMHGLVFASLHIIYPDPAVVLPLTFVGGVVLTLVYSRFRNLWWVTATHVVFNIAAMMFCFVSFVQAC